MVMGLLTKETSMPAKSSSEKVTLWKHHIELQRGSGLSVQKWCDEKKLSASTFHYWQDRLYPKVPADPSLFREVVDPKPEEEIIVECRIIRLTLKNGSALADSLRSLMGGSC